MAISLRPMTVLFLPIVTFVSTCLTLLIAHSSTYKCLLVMTSALLTLFRLVGPGDDSANHGADAPDHIGSAGVALQAPAPLRDGGVVLPDCYPHLVHGGCRHDFAQLQHCAALKRKPNLNWARRCWTCRSVQRCRSEWRLGGNSKITRTPLLRHPGTSRCG